MKLSIYLHKDRVDILRTFGDNLSDVINKILDESDNGAFDIEDKPECESRAGACRYDIRITNENYVNMLKSFGVKSKRISLRRLVYWFVDNEIYNDIGWEATNTYLDTDSIRFNKKLDNIISDLTSLSITSTDFEREAIDEVIDSLNLLRR